MKVINNEVPRFLKVAIAVITIIYGLGYGYDFASEFNLFIRILSSITGALIAIGVNEEIYYRSRNLNKLMRIFWCFTGSFAGLIITMLFFTIIKLILK